MRPIRRTGLPLRSFFVLIIVTGWLCSGFAAAQNLAVLSRSEDVMVFHDLETGEEIGRVEVGPFTHEIASDTARTMAYAPSYGGDVVYAVDLRSRTAVPFPMAPHDSLHGVVSNQDGSIIWVTSETDDSLLEISGANGRILKTWPTYGKRSHMVTVTRDQTKVYVANINSGSLSIINRETGETKVLKIGSGTEGIDITPDSREVWVSDRRDKTVSVVSTETDEVLKVMDAGGNFPLKLHITPDGQEAWVSHHRGNTVAIFDVPTKTMVAMIEVGRRPLGLGFSPDGLRAYVSLPRENEIVEIDTSTREILRRIPTVDNPDGVLWYQSE